MNMYNIAEYMLGKDRKRKMEKNRSSKIIAVVALIIAVFGLTLGFAAFSTTLTISSSATVTPSSENFKVYFSPDGNEVSTGEEATALTVTGTGTGAGTATIDTTRLKASNLTAAFTVPGQTVTYSFYVVNQGSYDAYLKSIIMENITGESIIKKCVKATEKDGVAIPTNEQATDELVAAACEKIKIKVSVGSGDKLATANNGSSGSISGHSLAQTANEPIVVEISYSDDGNVRADGPFNVSFGDIKLNYSTIDS